MLNQSEVRSIIKKTLVSSKAEETEVALNGGTTTNLRFARNTPSTGGTSENVVLSIRSTFGKRSGSATVNQLDETSIKEAVLKSEELAQLSPEDPEFVPALGPQRYPKVSSFFEKTARSGPDFLAGGAEECIRQAAAKGLVAAGFLRVNAGFSALGNSKSLFAYTRSTTISMSETVRTADGDGSGWVARAANRIDDINFKDLARIAVEKAVRSAKPRRMEPRNYVTILEPSCVADMLQNFTFSMDARNADEGRSFFSKANGNKIGDRICPDFVNIYSDPSSAIAPGTPWGESGLPQKRIDWIKKGRLENLRYSRAWAARQGKEPTPFPTNLIMKGGKGTLQDLIASTKEGVLVTSFWYIRGVNPQTLLLTGLTRDGVFSIENGKVAFPIMNFRWNESPAAMLTNIEAMSKEMRVPPRESGNPNIVVPALKLKAFGFSSLSEAV